MIKMKWPGAFKDILGVGSQEGDRLRSDREGRVYGPFHCKEQEC